MSAFRGARLFSSLGNHALKCNRLHQRRIVSLGLTSLCQVNMKKQAMLDTITSPVNKFDLSSVGVLSPMLTTLLSTDILEVAEEDSDLLNEEDAELGIGRLPFTATKEALLQNVVNIKNFDISTVESGKVNRERLSRFFMLPFAQLYPS